MTIPQQFTTILAALQHPAQKWHAENVSSLARPPQLPLPSSACAVRRRTGMPTPSSPLRLRLVLTAPDHAVVKVNNPVRITHHKMPDREGKLNWLVERDYLPAGAAPGSQVTVAIKQKAAASEASGRNLQGRTSEAANESMRDIADTLTKAPRDRPTIATLTEPTELDHVKDPGLETQSGCRADKNDFAALDEESYGTEEILAALSPTDTIEYWLCPASAAAEGLTGFDHGLDPARTTHEDGKPKELFEYPLEYAVWFNWFTRECRRRYAPQRGRGNHPI